MNDSVGSVDSVDSVESGKRERCKMDKLVNGGELNVDVSVAVLPHIW